jgi:hypothetical protein
MVGYKLLINKSTIFNGATHISNLTANIVLKY